MTRIKSNQPQSLAIEDDVTIIDSLPSASLSLRYKRYVLRGASGTRDRYYICLKSDSDTYSFTEISNGGA